MVNRLLETDPVEKTAVTEFDVLKGNVFCNDGHFSASGIIEHMAQSCALKSGFEASAGNDENKPAIGYIGAVKNVKIKRFPIPGEVLRSTLRVVTQIQQVSVVEIRTTSENEEVATAQLHIYQMNES